MNLTGLFKEVAFKNFLFLALTQGSNILLTLVITPVIFKAVGVDNYGYIALSLSIVALLHTAVNFGFHTTGPRDVAIVKDDKLELSTLFQEVITSKLVLALAVVIVLLVLTFSFDLFAGYQLIFLFSLILLFSEAMFPFWFLQGLNDLRWVTVGNVVAKLLYLLLLTVFVSSPEDASWVNLLLGMCVLSINILLIIKIRSDHNISLRLSPLGPVFRRIKTNIYYFLTSVAGYLSAHSGLIILSYFAQAVVLGQFGLAQRVASLMRLLPTLIVQSTLPKASQLYTSDKNGFIIYVKKVLLIALSSTLLMGILCFHLADLIIVLLSGGENLLAVDVLRILAFVPFVASLNIGNMLLLIAADRKELLLRGTSIAVCLIVGLSILFTYFAGAIGLCYALLIAEVITFAIQSAVLFPVLGEIFIYIYGKPISSNYSD